MATRRLASLAKVFLLVAFSAVLSACGDNADSAAIAKGKDEAAAEAEDGGGGTLRASFLDIYLKETGAAGPPKSLDVAGAWRGVVFCPSGTFPLSISVSGERGALTGSMTIAPALRNARVTTPFYADHVDRAADGDYAPSRQALTMTAPIPADGDPRKARGLLATMLLSPDAGDRALVTVTELSKTRGGMRRCAEGLIAKGAEGEALAAFAEKVKALAKDRSPVTQTTCPVKYRAWIEANAEKPDWSLLDDDFEAAFGKPYLSMSADEMTAASRVMMGSCVSGVDRRTQIKYVRVAGALRDYRALQSAYAARFKEAVVASWIAFVEGEIDRGAAYDFASAVKLRSLPIKLGLSGAPLLEGFDSKAAKLVDEAKTLDRELQFVQRLEARRDDFEQLIAIARRARQYDDVDEKVITRGLDFYLQAAAQRYAEAAVSARDAVAMAAWRAGQDDGGPCPARDERICGRVSEIFTGKIDALSDGFAASAQSAFADLEKPAAAGALAAQLASYERELRARYGLVFENAAFDDLKARLMKARRAAQKKAAKAIAAEIGAAQTAPEINALRNRYFLAGDLEADAMKRVRTALAAALSGKAPFAALSYGAYFDALYNRDFKALRQLDRTYLEGVRPLMAFGLQQLSELGPLLDAMAGRRAGESKAEIAQVLDNLTAVYAVTGAYLLDYQSVYGKCLRDDAITMTVTTKTDFVTRNGFGTEIGRRPGWTTQDAYRVNAEFAGQLRALFNTANDSAQAQLLDFFLNDATISELRSATRALMREFDCNAPEIKQLEAGLLAYDAEIAARMQR